jgi:hypothetical protein
VTRVGIARVVGRGGLKIPSLRPCPQVWSKERASSTGQATRTRLASTRAIRIATSSHAVMPLSPRATSSTRSSGPVNMAAVRLAETSPNIDFPHLLKGIAVAHSLIAASPLIPVLRGTLRSRHLRPRSILMHCHFEAVVAAGDGVAAIGAMFHGINSKYLVHLITLRSFSSDLQWQRIVITLFGARP